MKRIAVILLALLLLLQCACGKKNENSMGTAAKERLEQSRAEQEEDEKESSEPKREEQTADAEKKPAAEEQMAAEEESAAEPEQPVQAPAEAPKPDVSAECALLAELMQTALVPLDWNNEYYEMVSAPVLATEPAALEGTWEMNPYGVSAALVTDANDDGYPELILQAGEVEQQFYVFTVRDGAVHCTGFGMLDNQRGEPVLVEYRDMEKDCTVLVSEGEAGSGAGNYHFLYWIDAADLSGREAEFCGFDEYSEDKGFYTVYRHQDEEISAEEFEALMEEFYAPLMQKAEHSFTPLGADAAGTVAQMLYLWAIER